MWGLGASNKDQPAFRPALRGPFHGHDMATFPIASRSRRLSAFRSLHTTTRPSTRRALGCRPTVHLTGSDLVLTGTWEKRRRRPAGRDCPDHAPCPPESLPLSARVYACGLSIDDGPDRQGPKAEVAAQVNFAIPGDVSMAYAERTAWFRMSDSGCNFCAPAARRHIHAGVREIRIGLPGLPQGRNTAAFLTGELSTTTAWPVGSTQIHARVESGPVIGLRGTGSGMPPVSMEVWLISRQRFSTRSACLEDIGLCSKPMA